MSAILVVRRTLGSWFSFIQHTPAIYIYIHSDSVPLGSLHGSELCRGYFMKPFNGFWSLSVNEFFEPASCQCLDNEIQYLLSCVPHAAFHIHGVMQDVKHILSTTPFRGFCDGLLVFPTFSTS